MKIYLAGPDVFLPDAAGIGKLKQQLCSQYGFIGLFPLDNEISPAAKPAYSKAIFRGNIAMLDEADVVLANLTPFRGVSADVGTVFEIGYGFARRKQIHGYSNVRAPYIQRIQQFASGQVRVEKDQRLFAGDGLAVEDFGHFDNLMIAEALLESGGAIVLPPTDPADAWRDMRSFEECLRRVKISAPSTRVFATR